MQVVFSSPAPAEGLHDLRPVGPWPLPGTVPARNGRLPWMWACSRCGRSAGNSSRAKELARSPCGGAEWQLTAAKHSLELDSGEWRCSRCWLQVRPQHSAQTERQACPVGECTSGEGRWLRGEAGLRELFGRLRAVRHFCEPDAAGEEPPPQRCRVSEASPAAELGSGGSASIGSHAVAAGAQWAGSGGLGAGDVHRGGVAGATAAGTGQGSSQQSPAARVDSGSNPLAEAEGATARRALKLSSGAARNAEVAAEDDAACQPPGTAAAALGTADHCLPSAAAASGSCGSGDADTGTAGPPLFARLQPYMGHVVAFAGRNLWCLNCFEVPRSAHRSWRHGRCGGVRPPAAMPPASRDCLVRQPAACSGLQASVCARWAELAGDLRLQ